MSHDPGKVLELAPASFSAPDRPAVITYQGARIYLHIHDAEYMRERSAWRQRLAAAHPDAGGNAAAFQRLIGQRTAWQAREAAWYARLGLLPPDGYIRRGVTQSIRLRMARARQLTSQNNTQNEAED